jgi:hypothetical protein
MILRMQCALGGDSALPRDRFVITPHFNVGQTFEAADADALAEDLATGLATWMTNAATANREITVTAYDAQGTKPVLPIGSAVRNAGVNPASTWPREIACCLSYYSGRNSPRYRGRIYVPIVAALPGNVTLGVRPSTLARDNVAALVPLLTGLGGTNVDWVVYSRVDDTARPVTNWWVDDEWDVQRRRGLRSTARTAGTATE